MLIAAGESDAATRQWLGARFRRVSIYLREKPVWVKIRPKSPCSVVFWSFLVTPDLAFLLVFANMLIFEPFVRDLWEAN